MTTDKKHRKPRYAAAIPSRKGSYSVPGLKGKFEIEFYDSIAERAGVLTHYPNGLSLESKDYVQETAPEGRRVMVCTIDRVEPCS